MLQTEYPVTGETPAMQFILDKRSYDTATSTVAAVSRGVMGDPSDQYPGAESVRFEDVLYRTQKGAFFVHYHRTVKFPKGKPVVEDTAEALTPEHAVWWVQNDRAMVLDATGLPLPEEA
jgi:hypothetical protein